MDTTETANSHNRCAYIFLQSVSAAALCSGRQQTAESSSKCDRIPPCLVLQQTLRSLVDILMPSVTKCSSNKQTVCRKVLPTSVSPTPLYDYLCVGEQVSFMVTDTDLRTLLTDVADFLLNSIWNRNSSVITVNRPRQWPVGPTNPLFQWVLWAFCSGETGRVTKLTSHPHLVLRLRMSGAKPALPSAFMTGCNLNCCSYSCSVERNFVYFHGV
jgi:hypothetical protein